MDWLTFRLIEGGVILAGILLWFVVSRVRRALKRRRIRAHVGPTTTVESMSAMIGQVYSDAELNRPTYSNSVMWPKERN